MANLPMTSNGILIPANATFEKVTTPFDRVTDSRRADPTYVVYPTGLSQSNVGAAEDLDWLAEQAGEERKDYLIELEIDKVNKLVQIKVTRTEGAGVQRVARSSDGRTLSFSLGGLFKQYRSVALKQKRQCPAYLDRENQRIILSLKASKAKRKTPVQGESAAKAKSAAKAAAPQEAPDTAE